jgi:hypothetical protein
MHNKTLAKRVIGFMSKESETRRSIREGMGLEEGGHSLEEEGGHQGHGGPMVRWGAKGAPRMSGFGGISVTSPLAPSLN